MYIKRKSLGEQKPQGHSGGTVLSTKGCTSGHVLGFWLQLAMRQPRASLLNPTAGAFPGGSAIAVTWALRFNHFCFIWSSFQE